jgi:drug/metabolite transporter (DMT)-like permease
MRYLSIFFAFGFETYLLNQAVDGMALAGAAVIVVGCVISVLTQGAKGGE